MKSISLIGILVLAVCGCPSDKPLDAQGGRVANQNLSPRRVMVIDSDFDTSLPIFQGKIAGTYTMYCDRKENKCELSRGLQYKPKQDARVLALREKWNKAVRERNFSSLSPDEVQYMNKNIVQSHGTSTAALVAYKNPNVQLYLVQKKEIKDDQKDTMEQIRELCADSKKLSEIEGQLQNRNIHWGEVIRGINAEGLAIHDFALRNDINLINKSYGTLGPDAHVRKMFQDIKCPIVGELLIQDSRIEHAQTNYMQIYDAFAPFLVIRSAGNEAGEINSDYDTAECTNRNGNHLLVGSYDAYDRVSRFSNYGDCVSFYALGSQVVSSTVGDILLPVDGTSFSSPLAVRFLTGFATMRPAQLKHDLTKHMDQRRFVKMDLGEASDIVFERGGRGPSILTAPLSSGAFFSRDWHEKEFFNDALHKAQQILAEGQDL